MLWVWGQPAQAGPEHALIFSVNVQAEEGGWDQAD